MSADEERWIRFILEEGRKASDETGPHPPERPAVTVTQKCDVRRERCVLSRPGTPRRANRS